VGGAIINATITGGTATGGTTINANITVDGGTISPGTHIDTVNPICDIFQTDITFRITSYKRIDKDTTLFSLYFYKTMSMIDYLHNYLE
jgi:hypothetical protein